MARIGVLGTGGIASEGGLNQPSSTVLADSGTLEALEAGLDGFRKQLQLPPKETK